MGDRAASEFKMIHGEPWSVKAELNVLDADGWEVVGVASAPHWRPVMLSLLMGSSTHVTIVLRRARNRA
jgi:hypothetical protein